VDDATRKVSRPKLDLRWTARLRSVFGARIIFNNASSSVECTVRDFSAKGAKLLVSPHVTVPNEFELDVPKKGRKYRARLMWQREGSCGVQFLWGSRIERTRIRT
jgi:hypothetical protein